MLSFDLSCCGHTIIISQHAEPIFHLQKWKEPSLVLPTPMVNLWTQKIFLRQKSTIITSIVPAHLPSILPMLWLTLPTITTWKTPLRLRSPTHLQTLPMPPSSSVSPMHPLNPHRPSRFAVNSNLPLCPPQ